VSAAAPHLWLGFPKDDGLAKWRFVPDRLKIMTLTRVGWSSCVLDLEFEGVIDRTDSLDSTSTVPSFVEPGVVAVLPSLEV
jgi:hypothetical protein